MLFLLGSIHIAEGKSGVERLKVKTAIRCDHCKACESCWPRLERAVYNVKGVKRVDLELSDTTLHVVFNPARTTADQIRQAISNAGYDADDVKAIAEGYKTLDACCRGE